MRTRIMKVCREEKKANRFLQDRSFSSRCIYFACFAQCLYQDQRKVVLEVHDDRKKEKTFSPGFQFVFRSSDDLCFILPTCVYLLYNLFVPTFCLFTLIVNCNSITVQQARMSCTIATKIGFVSLLLIGLSP